MIVIRKNPPIIKELKDIRLPLPDTYTLKNKIEVHCIQGGTEDILQMEIVLPVGTYQEKKKLAAICTNFMVKEGTKNHTAKQIADKIDYYGASMIIKTFPDYGIVKLKCLKKFFEKMLPLIKEILGSAIFPKQELDTFIRNSKQKLKLNNEKNDFIARKKFNEVIFGPDHPYGYYVTESDYDNIKVDDLITLYHDNYSSSKCKIFLAGRIDQQIKDVLATYLGNNDWGSNVLIPKKNHETVQQDRLKLVIEKPGSVQSAIRIGKPLFTKSHPDHGGMLVLNTVLGGYYGSRLMSNLRQEKGYTYGIYSSITFLLKKGYFFIATEVDIKHRKNALNEIYKEIDRLQTELVPENELSLVRNYLLGNGLTQIDGPFNTIETMKGLILFDLKIDYFYNVIDTIKSIGSKELRYLAQQYLSQDTMYELCVGK